MDQKLADQKPKRELKIGTQTWKILEIWRKIPKTDFNKESDPLNKVRLKGELYTKIQKIYESEEGTKIQRSTVRRCVNSLMNKAK